MVDKISGASPAAAATGPTSGADFAKELVKSGAKAGASSFKTPTAVGAQAAQKPGAVRAAPPSRTNAAQRPAESALQPSPAHADRTGAAQDARATSRAGPPRPTTGPERSPGAAPAGEPKPIERPGGAQILGEVQRAQARLDQILKMAESGRTFSPAELLAFQAHTYRASQELEMAGKVVEKSTSAVKQTLQTQI